MSFEGYYQILCENGHYVTEEAYSWTDDFECPFCKSKVKAWQHMVDLTNGSWDDEGNRIDGYVEMKVRDPAKMCSCEKCGHTHETEPAIYEVPQCPSREKENQ